MTGIIEYRMEISAQNIMRIEYRMEIFSTKFHENEPPVNISLFFCVESLQKSAVSFYLIFIISIF